MNKFLEIIKRNKTTAIIISFFIVGFLLYVNSFQNQMFWDDHDGIINNAYIKDWSHFPKFFSENLIAGSGLISNYWRPLLLTVFSIEWHLWGDSVMGYHVVNTLAHVGAAVLLFLVLRRIFKNGWLSLLTAFVFLIHPLQTEAVTYISGLADPLSTVFMLLGTWFYLNFRDEQTKKSDSWNYILAISMYPLALMTKDSAVIMPGLVALVDYFYSPNLNLTLWERLKQTIRNTYPFFLITAIYAFLRATTLNFQNTFNLYDEANVYTTSFMVRLFTFFEIITVYFGLIFAPHNLHMERTVPLAHSLFQPQVIAGLVISLGLFFVAFKSIVQRPILAFGIFWFFGILFPHSNLLVPTAGLLYEHWLYLPMVGIWLSLFSTIQNLSFAKHKLFQYISIIFLVCYFLFFSFMTITRNREWKDPITFYNQTLKYAPTSYRIVNNLGMAYADVESWREADEKYRRAIELQPDSAVAWHNLGNSQKNQNNIPDAIANFNKAIEIDPSFFYSYNALTTLYLDDGDYANARTVQERYLPHSPAPIQTLLLLTQIALDENNKEKARDYLAQALKLSPGNKDILNAINQIK